MTWRVELCICTVLLSVSAAAISTPIIFSRAESDAAAAIATEGSAIRTLIRSEADGIRSDVTRFENDANSRIVDALAQVKTTSDQVNVRTSEALAVVQGASSAILDPKTGVAAVLDARAAAVQGALTARADASGDGASPCGIPSDSDGAALALPRGGARCLPSAGGGGPAAGR